MEYDRRMLRQLLEDMERVSTAGEQSVLDQRSAALRDRLLLAGVCDFVIAAETMLALADLLACDSDLAGLDGPGVAGLVATLGWQLQEADRRA